MTTPRALLVVFLSIVFCASTWAYRQQPSGASLTAQDYAEIQQLYARYNFTIDGSDAEGYANLFVPDGSFNANNGRDALIAFVKGRKSTNLRHWNTNLMITPTPEGARGAVYLMFLDVGVNPPVITGAAKYDDTLVKTGDGWRFKRRTNQREGTPTK